MIAPTTAAGRIWEEATTPDALQLAHAFEARWRDSQSGRRPEPVLWLPEQSSAGSSGLLLALLRVDLAQRREAGEVGDPESYRDRYPGLSDEVLTALIYEDFCLREEAGECPLAAEYVGRFPTLAGGLREIFEIHNLVQLPAHPSTAARGRRMSPLDSVDPASCPTIGGFFIVGELGRGSFARVFLARERQLGDRLVALKVSRTGSREPQALARLQHTNIVPVHSYRIDPATDWHLLCMPYFGRVTLAKLLDDPALGAATTGAALVAALDRLVAAGGEPGEPEVDASRPGARQALAQRSWPRAIAWWGAQMAAALRHAHDRGVLHHDLKPSNILITADGTPMLLDFNLAREVATPAATDTRLGGTLAYMAPEHLAALLAGHDEGVDHRADLYALGLILVEMLGTKPLEPARRTESPGRLLDRRRQDSPRLPTGPRPLPPGLVAVLRRCLAPDPADRYASAGDLATDLQAVADDKPLAFAPEPWPARSARWLRQNRAAVLGAGVVGLVILGGVGAWFQAHSDRFRRRVEAEQALTEGTQSAGIGEFRAAIVQFGLAAERTEGDPELAEVRREAERRQGAAEAANAARDAADAFFERAEGLRFAILGFVGDLGAASRDLITAFGPLGILTDPNWATGRLVMSLDAERRNRLVREVDDLLFFWVVAAARAPTGAGPPAAPARREPTANALAWCDRALAITAERGPWLALRAWWRGRADGDPDPAPPELPGPMAIPATAAACFRWALLAPVESSQRLAWLKTATQREPGNYWHQFTLAFEADRQGDQTTARAAYDAAIALRHDVPWAWKNRAMIASRLGNWAEAVDDLTGALAVCRTPLDQARVRIELGRTYQRLGAFAAARIEYARVIAVAPTDPLARDARRDRARLEADAGATDEALALYDAALAPDPRDWAARIGRANLALRRGHRAAAGRDLDWTIAEAPPPFRAIALGHRAAALLAAGRPDTAATDAMLAAATHPSPALDRLLTRCQLALGHDLDPWPDSPSAFDQLPPASGSLRTDLRRAADRLAARLGGVEGGERLQLRRRRAILLAAAGDADPARAEANQLVAEAAEAPETWLTLGQVERHAGRGEAAEVAVAHGLTRAPEHAGLIALRGLIRVDRGDFAAGLTDLAVGYARGAAAARGLAMARALAGLGREAEAAELWAWLAATDPHDIAAHLGLADARRRLGQWDRALASLEAAAGLVDPRSPVLHRLILAYAACLPARPDRWPRVEALGRSWLISRWSAGAAWVR